MNWNEMSNAEITFEIGKRIREYRLKRKLTQENIAGKAGISLFTVAQIERGKPVSIAMFIPVLRVLRLLDNLEMLLPEIEISPIELLKLKKKQVKRIRPKK